MVDTGERNPRLCVLCALSLVLYGLVDPGVGNDVTVDMHVWNRGSPLVSTANGGDCQ